MLVGGVAAAAAVCHLQDVGDDGLFVHRGTRQPRGRGRRRGGWPSDWWLAHEQLLLAATLQVRQQVLQLTGLRSATEKNRIRRKVVNLIKLQA